MHRARALLGAALALGLLTPTAGLADPVKDVQAAVEPFSAAGARFADKAAEQAAATCRRDPAGREECARVLGTPDAGAAAIDAYEASETSRVLDLQRSLGDPLPLNAGLWIGTHNSANSTSEQPSLSQSDSNQQLSLTDQLRLDVRSLELDAHWWPSLRSPGRAPVLCHAQGQPTHAGCTTERLLETGLREVRSWLEAEANREEVVLLYLEDHLEGRDGHDRAAGEVAEVFAGMLYAPPARTECAPLPPTLTRDQLRAAGARVVVMTGGCTTGVGTAWHGVAFVGKPREEHRPVQYGDYPTCGGFAPVETDGLFLRYFEDSTFFNHLATLGRQTTRDEGLTPETVRAMTRCGVDLLGLDQLVPGDGRLDALVWSFAPGALEAPVGACAVQRSSDGRWTGEGCKDERRPAACRTADGRWTVTGAGPRVSAAGRCEEVGAVFAVPRRGLDAQLLLEAQRAAGAQSVWLALTSTGAGGWA